MGTALKRRDSHRRCLTHSPSCDPYRFQGGATVIRLYQFAPAFGLPNASPFCMKMETYLRMAALPFELVNSGDVMKAPKHKHFRLRTPFPPPPVPAGHHRRWRVRLHPRRPAVAERSATRWAEPLGGGTRTGRARRDTTVQE